MDRRGDSRQEDGGKVGGLRGVSGRYVAEQIDDLRRSFPFQGFESYPDAARNIAKKTSTH